jgi:hypothetical protein
MQPVNAKLFSPPWELADWRVEVEAWARARLAERGLAVTGPIEQIHVQLWSTVLSIPTQAGKVYFKAGGPTQQFEPALLELLNAHRPGSVLAPLATDAARGWSLQPDGGATLRQALQGKLDVDLWARLLADYARLQIASAGWQPELLATGLPDQRLEQIPGALRAIVADPELQLVRDEEDFLTQAQFDRLKGMDAEFEQLCAELRASPIPAALEHGDLHDGNIFASGQIYDWGDASLTFPFFTLILPIRHTATKLEVSEYAEHPALLQLRDAYLKEWREFANFDELVKLWEIAFRLGKFVRAVSWNKVVKLNDPAHGNKYQGWVSGWLLEGLNHPI